MKALFSECVAMQKFFQLSVYVVFCAVLDLEPKRAYHCFTRWSLVMEMN